MKTFEEIYEELQDSNNSELNDCWREAKKESMMANTIAISICLIIDILFFINASSLFFKMYIIMFMLVINLIVIVVTKILFSKNKNKFNIKYKNIVIKKLMSNFYDNLEYFPDKPMPEYIYGEVEYNEHYNRYKSDDYLKAKIDDKYSIQMAEIMTQKEETYKDSDGTTHTKTITKFHGVFAKVLMNKSINSELKIMQNGKLVFENRLKMDSSEFEKYFDVKASNSIVGMQLLTADIMEELIEFENKTNMKFDVFIKNNELYIRFHSGEMFEIKNLKNGPLDKESIQKYFYMLNFTYNLSKRLIDLVEETQI